MKTLSAKNDAFGEIKYVIDDNGNAWFYAKSVSEILGISKDTMDSYISDQIPTEVKEINGNISVTLVGLVSLASISGLPERMTNSFKKWAGQLSTGIDPTVNSITKEDKKKDDDDGGWLGTFFGWMFFFVIIYFIIKKGWPWIIYFMFN
jgi:hypothetical protein